MVNPENREEIQPKKRETCSPQKNLQGLISPKEGTKTKQGMHTPRVFRGAFPGSNTFTKANPQKRKQN